MEDAQNIEQLRELAFASLPHASRKVLCWLRKDSEKEEGELSADEPELSEFRMACPAIGVSQSRRKNNRKAAAAARKRQRISANAAKASRSLSLANMPECQDKAADLVSPPANRNPVTPKSNANITRTTSNTWSLDENPFLIRFFDDDSDSEEEAEATVPSTVGLTSNPASLSLEINRMKKQIAAMERKSMPAPAKVKSSKPPSFRCNAPVIASADLEALRRQIASKESELQRQRMRLSSSAAPPANAAPPAKLPVQKEAVPPKPSPSPEAIVAAEPEDPRGLKHPRAEGDAEPNKKAKLVHVPTQAASDTDVTLAATVSAGPLQTVTEQTRLDNNVSVTGTNNVIDPLKELERQEEALDSELEMAQQLRHRCEVRERLARKAYREAQEALRLSNLECDKLLQKRELLSLRLRAAELSHYSSRTFRDEQLSFEDPFAFLSKTSEFLANDALGTALVPLPVVEEPVRPGGEPEKTFKDDETSSDKREHERSDGKRDSTEASAENQSDKQELEKLSVQHDSVTLPSVPILVTETEAGANLLEVEDSAGPASLEVAVPEQPALALNTDLEAKVSEDQDDLQGSSSSGYASDRRDDEDYIGLGNNAEASASPIELQVPSAQKEDASAASSLDEEDRSPLGESMECGSGDETAHGKNLARVAQPFRMSGGLLVVFRQFAVKQVETGFRLLEDKNHMPNAPFGREAAVPNVYESPLVIFRSLRASPRFSVLGLPADSKTWNHSIDPFKSLCKYEHRGKCNNELCTMQHKREYELDSSQVLKNAQSYNVSDALNMARTATSCHWKWTDAAADVPVYRIGTHLIKDRQHRNTSNDLYDYMSSIATARPLLQDMPRLLDGSSSNSTSVDHSDGIPKRDRSESRLDFGDIDLCLVSSFSILRYDANNMKNSNHLKNALRVLSRSLEMNPLSEVLWVVYLKTFYKQSSPSTHHDLFQEAVRCNKSSYILWSMYVESRTSLKVQLESYEQAIVALSDANGPEQNLSASILDMALKMLCTMALSDSTQQIVSWTDDLVADTVQEADTCPRRKSTSRLLRSLRPCDACVLWVSCGYLAAYGSLPKEVVDRLGCKQELPSSVDWEVSLSAGEESRGRVLRLLKCATSSGVGCLELTSSTTIEAQVLAVNYLKFLVAFEGLERAAAESQKLMQWQPHSVELIVLCANIEKQRRDSSVGLAVFERGISSWPSEKAGIQMLWNQYAGHTLEWIGAGSALSVLDKCASSTRELCHLPCTSKSRYKHQEPVDTLKYLSSGSHSKRDPGDIYSLRDLIFSLLNIALYEGLRGHTQEAQSYLEKALSFDEGFAHCWQEYAAFCFHDVTGGSEDFTWVQRGLMAVMDRCHRQSRLSAKLRPLGREFLEDIKRYRNRCFIENMLGVAPVDYSFINSLLRMSFGPDLLPSDLKAVEQFAGGLLEHCPGNVALALALCRAVKNKLSNRPCSVSTSVWATSLLINSLQTSVPSEASWLEAITLVEQLNLEASLTGFYSRAEAAYPFSARLQRRRLDYCKKKGAEAAAEGAKASVDVS